MTAIEKPTISKLSKLIPLLASDQDGEVVATARAIQRLLKTAGADLHDIVAALEKPHTETVVIYRDKIIVREKVVYRDPPATVSSIEEPELPGGYTFKDVRTTADRLLDPTWCEMNEVETKFVRSIRDSAHKHKGKFHMSPKQANWFRRLVDEYLGMEIKE